MENTPFTDMPDEEFQELLDRQEKIVGADLPLFPSKETMLYALREINRQRVVIAALQGIIISKNGRSSD